MPDALVTLTTDFGTGSPYVAAMKGVILSINPDARLVDLCHSIPPQDVAYAAFFLAQAVPYYPKQALHVVVVDPGVGTDRKLLYVEMDNHRLLCPDNGVWTLLNQPRAFRSGERKPPENLRVTELTNPQYWRPSVSPTFHGRDILAPVAAHLSLGIDSEELGTETDHWIHLPWPSPTRTQNLLKGRVIFVDGFGNLITNVQDEELPETVRGSVRIGDEEVTQWVRTYGEASPGELVALISSSGFVEVAAVNGSAAKQLNEGVGTEVELAFS